MTDIAVDAQPAEQDAVISALATAIEGAASARAIPATVPQEPSAFIANAGDTKVLPSFSAAC